MSSLPAFLDPYAVGDFDTRCRDCSVNLDDAPTGVHTCPGRRPDGSDLCSDCCGAFCCADLAPDANHD